MSNQEITNEEKHELELLAKEYRRRRREVKRFATTVGFLRVQDLRTATVDFAMADTERFTRFVDEEGW